MEIPHTRTISLETEQQLRIYMLPLRQRIMRFLRVAGKPVTSKHVADQLGIAPSSARHHLLRLQEIGVVEHDHYELVNGIRAEYLKAANINVSIGTNKHDDLAEERDSIVATLLSEITGRFQASLPIDRQRAQTDAEYFPGDFLGGIMHLSQEDARACYTLVRNFLDVHAKPASPEDRPWEFAILFHEVST